MAQSAETIEIAASVRTILKSEYQVAIIADNALSKMQLRRVVNDERAEEFDDMSTAEIWLRT